MKTFVRSFLISLLVVRSLLASAQVPSLSGVVTDAMTHAPIGQADVTTVGGSANSDVTDSKGKFVLRLAATVKPGDTVELRVRKNGYTTYDEKVAAGELALTIELQRTNSRRRSSAATTGHSYKEEMQRELLRHSFAVRDFTVEWTLHLPDGFTMGGQPKDGYKALSLVLCRPLRDSIFNIVLVPPDAAPFGRPRLSMQLVTRHVENDPGCNLGTNLVTLDEKGELKQSNGFGYDLQLISYDERHHLLSLRSLIRGYTLVELKTPRFMLSDFGEATSKLPWSDAKLPYGVLAFQGKDLGSITLDQVPKSVDIVVRPNPPEGDLDSRWTITTTGLPLAVDISTWQLDIPYERRD